MQGVEAVDKGLVTARIPEQRVVAGRTRQIGAVVGLVLGGNRQTVAQLVADRKGLGEREAVRADRRLAGQTDENARRPHVGEGLADQKGLGPVDRVVKAGDSPSKVDITLRGGLRQLREGRQDDIAVFVARNGLGRLAGLPCVELRGLLEFGLGVCPDLQPDLILQGRAEVVQPPEAHKEEYQQGEDLDHAGQPAEKAALFAGVNQPDDHAEDQRCRRRLPEREGDPAEGDPETAYRSPGNAGIKGEPEIRQEPRRRDQSGGQSEQDPRADQIPDGLFELEHVCTSFQMKNRGRSSTHGEGTPPALAGLIEACPPGQRSGRRGRQ